MNGIYELGQEPPDDESIEEFIRRQTGGREPEVDCEAAIEEGFSMSTCLHPRGTMQLIACLGNRLQNGASASEAWREAWRTAERQCGDLEFKLRDMLEVERQMQSQNASQCDDIWQQVAQLGLDEMAERNVEISEENGREVGNRVCSIDDGPPSMGTEDGLTMAPCTGEEIADHHHHVSQGGGKQGFSNLDVFSMAGRDLDISCITYPDGDDMMMECADVQSIDDDVLESLQESWKEYFDKGSVEEFRNAYKDIYQAKDDVKTCYDTLPQMSAQDDYEWLF